MKLRLLKMISVVIAAAIQTSCCPEYPCETNFDLPGWCATSKSCRLDGRLITKCDCCGKTPDCELWNVAPGIRLEIPLNEVWPLLGKRNDLRVTWGQTFGDESNVELLFDGVPESDGMCTRQPGPGGEVLCMNLPQSLTTLEFRYQLPISAGRRALVYMDMHDTECESTHEVCPL